MISSGTHTFRNCNLLREGLTAAIFHHEWLRNRGDVIEGINLPDARAIKQAVSVPVLCTGGFQTASVIRKAIDDGNCDAVSIARSLVANNDLVKQFAAGADRPAVPCTYCNKCLENAIKNPVGCYEEARFASHDAMVNEIYSVVHPPQFAQSVRSGVKLDTIEEFKITCPWCRPGETNPNFRSLFIFPITTPALR